MEAEFQSDEERQNSDGGGNIEFVRYEMITAIVVGIQQEFWAGSKLHYNNNSSNNS